MRISDLLEHDQEVFLFIGKETKKEESVPCRVKEVGDLSLLLRVIDKVDKLKYILPGTRAILFGYKGNSEFKLLLKIIESNSLPELRLMLTELDLGKQRREYVRVDVSFPVQFQPVEINMLDSIRDSYEKGIRGRREPSLIPTRLWQREREEIDKMEDFEVVLIQLMIGIHQKLDRVLSLAERNMQTALQEAKGVDLSGSGIGIVARGDFQPGDHLEMHFTLPIVPPTNIQALGKIVYSKTLEPYGAENNNYQLGLQFVYLNEEDRDLVIWYTFQQQRRFLKERHKLI